MSNHSAPFDPIAYTAAITAADSTQMDTELGRLRYIQLMLGNPQFNNINQAHWDHQWPACLSNSASFCNTGLLTGSGWNSVPELALAIPALPNVIAGGGYPLLSACRTSDDLQSGLADVNGMGVFQEIQRLWAQNILLQYNLSSLFANLNAAHSKATHQLDDKHTQDLNLLMTVHENTKEQHLATVVAITIAKNGEGGGRGSGTDGTRFDHPDKFEGITSTLSTWIVDIAQKINNETGHFPTTISKVAYALSRLGKEAKTSVAYAYDKEGMMKLDDTGSCEAFPTLSSVFNHLRTAFGDTDESFTAEAQIIRIKMGDGVKNTFPAFATNFLRTCGHLNWDSAALSSILYSALHPLLQATINDKIPNRPTLLHTFIDLIRDQDARLRRTDSYTQYNKSYKLFGKSITNITDLNPSAPPVISTSDPDAMVLDAANFDLINGKLKPGVAALRRSMGRCGYCNMKHQEDTCQLLTTKKAKELAAAQKLVTESKN